MGMYTELVLGITIKQDIPPTALIILRSMLAGEGQVDPLNPHPLFKTERWQWMLRAGGSYVFPSRCECTLSELDTIGEVYYLNIRINLKNYAGELQEFCDWLAPWVETCKHAGYIRYEEDDLPTLIYFRKGKPQYITLPDTLYEVPANV